MALGGQSYVRNTKGRVKVEQILLYDFSTTQSEHQQRWFNYIRFINRATVTAVLHAHPLAVSAFQKRFEEFPWWPHRTTLADSPWEKQNISAPENNRKALVPRVTGAYG